MARVHLTQNDFNETDVLAGVLLKIDQIDENYVNVITDEIFKFQPFFLSTLLGYHQDVSMEQLEEIMKIYFVIWEYFVPKARIKTKQITEADFYKAENKNIGMLKYCEGELIEDNQTSIYADDIQKLKSKSLWTAVLFRFNERPIINKMDTEIKAPVLIGIKSFIECFENI